MSEIRLLFIAANQSDPNWDRLSLDEESRQIRQKISEAQARDLFNIRTLLNARWSDLRQELQNFNPHIIHFSGHGGEEGQLYFLSDDGKPHPVKVTAIKRLFATHKEDPTVPCALQLVVFNACYSEAQAKAVIESIDFAIGMNREIGDDVAVAFSAAFYNSIASKRPVKTAFEFGLSDVDAFDLGDLDEADAFKLFTREGVDAKTLVLVKSEVPVGQTGASTQPVPTRSNEEVVARAALVKTLSRILPAQLTFLTTLLNMPLLVKIGSGASHAEKIEAFLDWAESEDGCGLPAVKAALDDLINSR